MSRQRLKTVSNKPEEFIPKAHLEYKKDAEKIEDRPLIFVGRCLNRDEDWVVRDIIELKDSKDTSKGVKGMGEAYKYMWENLITEVKNVMAEDGDHDSLTGEKKDALWYSEGMEEEINEAITHFYTKGKLSDEEVKTSV